MFALPPQVISVPVFSFGVGGIDWPWFGPVAAWTVGAVLIAVVLNMLRHSTDRTHAALASGTPCESDACLGVWYQSRRSEPRARSVLGQAALSKVA